MTDPGPMIPVTDEQAKAAQEGFKATQEALKTLQGAGSYIGEVLGTVPQDIVALLAGNWLKVRRAEQLKIMLAKSK
jgi:hypothetical protein